MLIKIIMKVIVLMIFHRYNIIYMHVYACTPGFLLINLCSTYSCKCLMWDELYAAIIIILYHRKQTRVFGEQFKIYIQVLKGVIVTFGSNFSIATKALHPWGC